MCNCKCSITRHNIDWSLGKLKRHYPPRNVSFEVLRDWEIKHKDFFTYCECCQEIAWVEKVNEVQQCER